VRPGNTRNRCLLSDELDRSLDLSKAISTRLPKVKVQGQDSAYFNNHFGSKLRAQSGGEVKGCEVARPRGSKVLERCTFMKVDFLRMNDSWLAIVQYNTLESLVARLHLRYGATRFHTSVTR
jgi:hypothetical protein